MVEQRRGAGMFRRHWRDYRTASGGRPVKDFVDELTDDEAAELVAAMKEVRDEGLSAAKHLRGDIYEVKAEGETRSLRLLFAKEGRFGHVLLSLSGFVKKTQKTPRSELELAERRLKDWRARGGAMRQEGS